MCWVKKYIWNILVNEKCKVHRRIGKQQQQQQTADTLGNVCHKENKVSLLFV